MGKLMGKLICLDFYMQGHYLYISLQNLYLSPIFIYFMLIQGSSRIEEFIRLQACFHYFFAITTHRDRWPIHHCRIPPWPIPPMSRSNVPCSCLANRSLWSDHLLVFLFILHYGSCHVPNFLLLFVVMLVV